MTSSAIITAAVIVGGFVAIGSILLSIGLLRSATAQAAIAAALARRNEIEAQKTNADFEAYRRGILREADEQATRRDEQVADQVVERIRIAGGGYWGGEGGNEGRFANPAGVVVEADERGSMFGRPQPGLEGTGVFSARLAAIGHYAPNAVFPPLPQGLSLLQGRLALTVAQDPDLAKILWDFEVNWNVEVDGAPQGTLPWELIDEAGHNQHHRFMIWMDTNYGYPILELEEQYPRLRANSPRYQHWLRLQQSGGHAAP